MKSIRRIFLMLLLTGTLTGSLSSRLAAQSAFSFQLFYDNLSPYGEWVDHPDYGYVWIPDVEDDFAPYGNNGYWLYTNAGWTWTSDYDWGWAAFHYGRWYFDPYYGYAWIPGDEWGPGWVTWRRSAGYYGWAPIGPGISIEFAYSNGYNQPYNHWRFVRDRDFGRSNIFNFYISTSSYSTIIRNSYVINNYYVESGGKTRYNKGPGREEVQRYTGNNYQPVMLAERNQPGQTLSKNNLSIYRPKIERSNTERPNAVPERTTGWNNGKPQTKHNADTRRTDQNQPALKNRPEVQGNNPSADKQAVKKDSREVQKTAPAIKTRPATSPRSTEPERAVRQPVSKRPDKKEQPVYLPPDNNRRPDPPVRPEKLPVKNEQPARQPQKEVPARPERIPAKKETPEKQPVKKSPAVEPVRKEKSPAPSQPVKQEEKERMPPARLPEKKTRNENPNKQESFHKPGGNLPVKQELQMISKETPIEEPKIKARREQDFRQQPDIRETFSRPLMPMPVLLLPQPVNKVPLKRKKMHGTTLFVLSQDSQLTKNQ